jgi:sterol 14-demethylase
MTFQVDPTNISKLFFAAGAIYASSKMIKIMYEIWKFPHKTEWPVVKGWPIIGCVEFYFGKAPFLDKIANLGPLVEFRVLHLRIFHVQGIEEITKIANASETSLSFNHATPLIIGGQIPNAEEIKNTPAVMKPIVQFLTPQLMQKKLPLLIKDVINSIQSIPESGEFDPFDFLYQVAFLLSTRMISADEFCEPQMNSKLRKLIDSFDENSAGFTPLIPLVPTPWKFKAVTSVLQIINIFKKTVQERNICKKENTDFLNFIIQKENGCPDELHYTFLLVALWVSVVNTGYSTAWSVLHLLENPDWLNQVMLELQKVVADDLHDGDVSQIHCLYSDLQKLSINGWNNLGLMDRVIQETVRLHIVGVIHRRVVKRGQIIYRHELPLGSFIVYSMRMLHLDTKVFPQPNTFNPDRWLNEQLFKEQRYYFTGFGTGKHPCVGKKLAKLEMKIILALTLSKWNMNVFVKDSGVKPYLQVDPAALTAPSPLQKGIRISYRPKE